MPESSTGERSVAVASAMTKALARLEPELGSFDRPGQPASAFAALGEVLFWLCALDELLSSSPSYRAIRDQADAGRSIHGLRFARNRVAHGFDVTTMTRVDPENAVLDLMVLDQARLDTPGILLWLPLNGIPPPSDKYRRRDQEDAYDVWVAGRPVNDTLEAASTWVQDNLGVIAGGAP